MNKNCERLLTNESLLQYPEPFNLRTDASYFAIGAILSQGSIGNYKPIAHVSRTPIETELKYSLIEKGEKEMLSIV